MNRTSQSKRSVTAGETKTAPPQPPLTAFRIRQGISDHDKLEFLRQGNILQLDTALVACHGLSMRRLRERISRNPANMIQRIKRWIDE